MVVRAALDASTRSLVPLPAFSSSLSYNESCVAFAARPICCRAARLFRCPHLLSPRRGGLVPHALGPGRQGSPDPLAPCGRSFRRRGPICERSSILSRSIDATSIGRTRSCPRLLTIVGFRDVRSPGLVFPVLCRDAETEAGAFHQRPAVRGQLGLRKRRSLQFQSSPQMGTGSV